MAWTGGYPEAGHNETVVIATGIRVSRADAREEVYEANAQIADWTFTGTAPADGSPAVTWSVTTRIRFRRRYLRDGSDYVPDATEELVVVCHIVPVDVEATITAVTATQLRWSVRRVV